jgi:hypothetical protein
MNLRRFCSCGRNSAHLSCRGLAPGDHEVNTRLHQWLAPLIEPDPALYLKPRRSEWMARAARLKAAYSSS